MPTLPPVCPNLTVLELHKNRIGTIAADYFKATPSKSFPYHYHHYHTIVITSKATPRERCPPPNSVDLGPCAWLCVRIPRVRIDAV